MTKSAVCGGHANHINTHVNTVKKNITKKKTGLGKPGKKDLDKNLDLLKSFELNAVNREM